MKDLGLQIQRYRNSMTQGNNRKSGRNPGELAQQKPEALNHTSDPLQ